MLSPNRKIFGDFFSDIFGDIFGDIGFLVTPMPKVEDYFDGIEACLYAHRSTSNIKRQVGFRGLHLEIIPFYVAQSRYEFFFCHSKRKDNH